MIAYVVADSATHFRYAGVHYQAGRGGEFSRHETSIITGALDLTEKTAKDAMAPISETFSLDINSKLNMYAPLFISN